MPVQFILRLFFIMIQKDVYKEIENGLNDAAILRIILNKNGQANRFCLSEKYFQLYPEIKDYLDNRFPKDEFLNYSTIIRRIQLGIEQLNICPVCGKKLLNIKAKHCSVQCQGKDKNLTNLRISKCTETKRRNKEIDPGYYKEAFNKSSEGYKKYYEQFIRQTTEYQRKLLIKVLKLVLKQKISEEKLSKKCNSKREYRHKQKIDISNLPLINKDEILIYKNDYINSQIIYKNMQMFGYIYKIYITNPKSSLNNSIYIGKKQGNPAETMNYFGSGIIIQSYINNYKKAASKNLSIDDAIQLGLHKQILDFAYNLVDLNEKEKYYIQQYQYCKLLNLTSGGDGHSGDPWNKGLTKETDYRIAMMSKNKIGSNNFLDENGHPWNYGLKYDQQLKDKISQATKIGMSELTDEQKDKLKSCSGRHYEIIDGIRVFNEYRDASMKRIQLVVDGCPKIFDSSIQAAKELGLRVSKILNLGEILDE